jgi:hypothetical protein
VNPSRRHVAVHVGVERPRQVQELRSKVAIFAVLPPTVPSLGEAWAGWRIKRVASPAGDRLVEHLRLPAGADLSRLPGLAPGWPSHLRDAVQLVFAGGARSIDLVVARAPELSPWDLAHPLACELLHPFLSEVPGMAVVLPDAAGPPVIGTSAPAPQARCANLVTTVAAWSSLLAESWQVGVVDLPDAPPAMLFQVLDDLAGSEFALCAFTGRSTDLRQHGWRSAAALVGGRIAATDLPSHSLVGGTGVLPGGRPRSGDRLVDLGLERPGRELPDFARHAVVEVQLGVGSTATITSEPTLRAPAGAWTLPMLRTAKLVHHRVVVTSNLFVFRNATPDQALTLQNALRLALEAFERKELIGGPLPDEPSRVVARAVSDPAEPALVANVTTFLRPWLRELRVDLMVRPGHAATVEVA